MAPTRGGPVDGTSFVRGDTTIERSRTIVMMLLADRYAELHETTRVRERTLFPPQRIPSELELQARWFAGDFGKHFERDRWRQGRHRPIRHLEETVLPFSPAGVVTSVARKSADAKLRLTRSPKGGATFVSEITAQ